MIYVQVLVLIWMLLSLSTAASSIMLYQIMRKIRVR